jgi:hypothetical protein
MHSFKNTGGEYFANNYKIMLTNESTNCINVPW